MIKQTGTVTVFVSDQDRAKAFYTDKLGFKVTADYPIDPHTRWLTVTAPEDDTEICLLRPGPMHDDAEELKQRIGAWTGIVFLTDDIDKTYKTLHDRGVEFDHEPRPQPWGGKEARFSDQDNNSFELVQRS
jgi:catechol 2,3-dioxygenase-like lactoylglutathione lyase family enzyme